jgi:hypothetical protein
MAGKSGDRDPTIFVPSGHEDTERRRLLVRFFNKPTGFCCRASSRESEDAAGTTGAERVAESGGRVQDDKA